MHRDRERVEGFTHPQVTLILCDLLPCNPDLDRTGHQINQGGDGDIETASTGLIAYAMSSR